MSSREHLYKRAEDASRAAAETWQPAMHSTYRHTALAVVDAILPQITDPKQLLGVPENSLLIATNEQGQLVSSLKWYNGKLHADDPGSYWSGRPPKWLLDQGMTLTVVWMP